MQKYSSELNYAGSSVYSLRYHLILVTKYRRDVLIADIKTELEELLKSMTEQFSGKIIEINIMPDHVHMLIDASPKHSISSMMKGYKGVSARMLFMYHPEIKEKLCGGHLWQPSYFACTVSERSEDMIREYIGIGVIVPQIWALLMFRYWQALGLFVLYFPELALYAYARKEYGKRLEIKERVVIVLSVLAGIEIISMAFF